MLSDYGTDFVWTGWGGRFIETRGSYGSLGGRSPTVWALALSPRAPRILLVDNPRTIADSILLYDGFLVEDGTFPRGITVEDVFGFRWGTVFG